MNPINYSIIIPHHNIPSLLTRCLNSIPQRDDTEIIIVDDNSSPEKVDFNNFPGMNRKNTICIFDKQGKGGGHARNIGLKLAKGKWIIFADADDFFNYCINDILNQYVNSSSDIIYCKSNSLYSNTYINANRANSINKFIDLYNSQKEYATLRLKYQSDVPWGKIIRKELIKKNNILFDETPITNDMTFSYLIGFHAVNISVCPTAIYCVTQREGSVSVSLSDTNILTRISVVSRAFLFFQKHNIPIKVNSHIKLLLKIRSNRKLYNKCIQEICKNGYNYKLLKSQLIQYYIKQKLATPIKKILIYISNQINKYNLFL